MKRSVWGFAVLAIACGNGGKSESKNVVTAKPPAGLALSCPPGASVMIKDRTMWCQTSDGTKQGPMARWNDKGAVTQRGAYQQGKMHGEWTHFAATGAKSSIARYDNGFEHGTFTWWHPNGKKSSESNYVQGRYHGTHTNYDLHGNPTEVNEYVHGQRVKAQKLKDGKKISEQTYAVFVPTGKAVTTSHPKVPAAWQACKEHHECVLQAATCCACGAGDSVGVHYKHAAKARKVLLPPKSCKSARCPSQMCVKIGARCDDGRCVSASG